MTAPFITFIGAGNMGASLIGGLIQHGHPANRLMAADPSTEKLAELSTQFHLHTTTDNLEAVHHADVVILAVKPQAMHAVLTPLTGALQAKKPLVISIAAGLRESTLQAWMGGNLPIVRAMPNTPALIGHGATGLYANTFVTNAAHDLAESILRAVGITVWVDSETLMDAITAVSGSGPAYFFLMMEALQAAGEKAGLPEQTARLLTLQTALGAAAMALESDASLATLRQRVTSPGGTTERGVSVLEEHKLRDILNLTVEAARDRSITLANELGETR